MLGKQHPEGQLSEGLKELGRLSELAWEEVERTGS